VAEGARLESVFRLIPNEGSNPSLSAKYNTKPRTKVWGFVAFTATTYFSLSRFVPEIMRSYSRALQFARILIVVLFKLDI
jgi:hypothetical protein